MKKLLLVPAFMLAFFFSTISSVSAADVWVNHINDLDIYVVEETLSGNSDNFSVVVKTVQNGQLMKQSTYCYDHIGGCWGGEEDRVKFVVYGKPDRLFEYCADRLGIYYYSDDKGFYY